MAGVGEADADAEAEPDAEAEGDAVVEGLADGVGDGSAGAGSTQKVRFATSIRRASFASCAFPRLLKHPIRSPDGAVRQ